MTTTYQPGELNRRIEARGAGLEHRDIPEPDLGRRRSLLPRRRPPLPTVPVESPDRDTSTTTYSSHACALVAMAAQ
jgi:hypothetical protein